MEGTTIPSVIQNHNLTRGLAIPHIDPRLYACLVKQFEHCLRCHDLGNGMSICLITKIKPQTFIEALPKFGLRHARKVNAIDGLCFQSRVYRPTVWVRSREKWVPYEFRDEVRSQDGLQLSRESIEPYEEMMEEIGRVVDSFPFGNAVALRLAPSSKAG